MRKLDVYFNDIKAGLLTEQHPGVDYLFQYYPDYLNSENPPVSLTLSKREGNYFSKHLFPFFTNMLPEGANRRSICNMLKIDENDLFGLLTAMANKDFIGAVNVRRITI